MIHNSLKLEAIQMSINQWIHKQTVVYPSSGPQFGNTKKWTTAPRSNKNELQKCYAKKPDTQDYILHDSIYMKFPEKANP